MKQSASLPDRKSGKMPVHHTFGRFFPDGSLIEAVSSREGNHLVLLRKIGENIRIDQHIEHEGDTYTASQLPENLLQQMHFPCCPAESGGIAKLFGDLLGVLQPYTALPTTDAELVAFWVISTWFADCLFTPPLL